MSERWKVQRGTKIEPREAMNLDRNQMSVGLARGPVTEVSGQPDGVLVVCPWCGQLNRVRKKIEHPEAWHLCGWCGGAYRA